MGNTALRRQEALVSQVMTKSSTLPEWATASHFSNMHNLQEGLRKAGLESSNLIVAVDFTKSNVTQGKATFHGKNLHSLDEKEKNPYENVLSIVGKTLAPFDDDNQIPAFYFGDAQTRHLATKSFFDGDRAGNGMDDVLTAYRRLTQTLDLSGPTSFAPVIDKAIEIVNAAGNTFHILVIIADGQVSTHLHCLKATRAALIRASKHPLAVVIVGVGDGPFTEMDSLDDDLPERLFDNTQFVDWTPFQRALDNGEKSNVIEPAFAVCALQEIPQQYRIAADLGLLEPASTREEQRRLQPRDGERPAKRHRAEPGTELVPPV